MKLPSNSTYEAQQHSQVIERFGRYPHRNAVLGRHSNESERAWLESSERPGWARCSKVENLGVSCEKSAMNHILNGDINTILALASPSLTSEIAQAIINNVKSQIKTATQKAIGEKH